MEWILRIATLTSTILGLTGYYILNSTVSWQDANGLCTLATPDITFNRRYLSLDIDPTTIEEDVEYWVGYTFVNKLLLYKGCRSESDVAKESIRNFTVFDGSPGLCFSACNTSLIGFQGGNCYCFHGNLSDIDSRQNCNVTVFRKPSGGPKSVSLFGVANVTLETKNETAEEGCVAFNQENKTFKLLEDCTKELRIVCQGQTSRTVSNIVSDDKLPWKSSGEYCFSKNKFPLREKTDIETDKESEHLFWTGMFLSGSVIKKIGKSGTPLLYGYVMKSEDKSYLIFKGREKDTRKAVCTNQSVSSVEETSAGSNSTISITTTITQTHEYKKSNDVNKHNDTRDNQILLYVLAPVITVIVIVAAVVAVVCYRKRAKPKTSRQNPALSREYSQVQDAYEDTKYAYSVPLDTLESTQRQQSNPNDEGAYDVSYATGRARDVDNHTERENVYNKLNTLPDDTYDRTNLTNTGGTIHSGKTFRGNDDAMYSTSQTRDDVYHTTLPKQRGPVVTENVYSHANNGETYSQTNRTANSKCSPTDNIYD